MKFLLLPLLPLTASGENLGCTALAIDGGATIAGGAFAVENTDCNNCDFRLNYVPPRNSSEGARRAVYMMPVSYPRWVGHGRGEIYHPIGDQQLSEPVAHIPEVPRTFGYWESISPLMNDQGLGMGESSCSALLQNKAPGSTEDRAAPTGTLDAMTLMQLGLERCATARCAVELMGALAEEHGFLPYGGEPTAGVLDGQLLWADSGEAYTIADASGEAWMLNVIGGVEGITKSVWAARRVPRGHVAPVANEFTLGELPAEQDEDYRFASGIFDAARTLGWDGQGPLHFTRTFAPDPTRYDEGNPPIPLYSSLRRWRLFNLAAPSLNLPLSFDQREYPFSVEAERPLSRRDVMSMMGDHYGGTEFDMTLGVLAGPFRTPFRVEGGPDAVGGVPRGISILRTLYSTITETGPEGSTLWYAADTPATSVYIPVSSRSAGGVSATYSGGHNRKFDRSAAWWAFSFVNNWMQLKYDGMSSEDVLPRKASWQDRMDIEVARKSGASANELAAWQIGLQEDLVADWWRLGDELVMKWNDMSRTGATTTDKADGYPEWWVRMIGFSQDVHPVWVQPATHPEPLCPGYQPATVSLPRGWNKAAGEWTDWTLENEPVSMPAMAQAEPMVQQTVVVGPCMLAVGLLIGFTFGRRNSRVNAVGADPLLG